MYYASLLIVVQLLVALSANQVAYLPKKELFRQSSVIVVGSAVGEDWVVDPTKGARDIRYSDGRRVTQLPNFIEYVKGVLYTVRVEEALKGGEHVSKGEVIRIFVEGSYNIHEVWLEKGKKYVVFMSQTTVDPKRFAGTVVLTPGKAGEAPFDVRSRYYKVTNHIQGAVELRDEDAGVVDRVRSYLREQNQ